MRLSDLLCYETITIQCHDYPDADTIGAGFGLYCFFQSKGCNVRLIYSGFYKDLKKNLQRMIESLHIPLEYVCPKVKNTFKGVLVTVDCQYGSGNVTVLKAEHVAVIDHHPAEMSNQITQYRIQSNLGSCATLVWRMLREEGYPVNGDINLGTALYYGLYTDTNQFAELFHPLDMDMREMLVYNKKLMNQFRNSNLTLKELELAGIAMIRYRYNEIHHFAVIKTQPCDPNILGIISDFLLQVEEVDCCVVYNEMQEGLKLSVRSCIKEVNANELSGYLTEGIGSGGGHYEKAGGFISMKRYEERYPLLRSEAYLDMRLTEYFESFSCIVASQTKLDTGEFTLYQRRSKPLCYIRVLDLVEAGARIAIRTQRGTEDLCIERDVHIALEKDGTIHVLQPERFEHCLQETDEEPPAGYWGNMEYVPVIKNWMDGNNYLASECGRVARPREQFKVYAKKLEKCTKVFPKWDEERYMLGMPGDYLTVSADDPNNIYIESGSNFLKNFQKCE